MKKWAQEQLNDHIRKNLGDGDNYSYGSAVVIAALHKKLYGVFPKIGMSGSQAEFADSIVPNLPEPKRLEG